MFGDLFRLLDSIFVAFGCSPNRIGGFWAERITIPYAVYWAERKSNIKAGRILRLPIWSGVEKME